MAEKDNERPCSWKPISDNYITYLLQFYVRTILYRSGLRPPTFFAPHFRPYISVFSSSYLVADICSPPTRLIASVLDAAQPKCLGWIRCQIRRFNYSFKPFQICKYVCYSTTADPLDSGTRWWSPEEEKIEVESQDKCLRLALLSA